MDVVSWPLNPCDVPDWYEFEFTHKEKHMAKGKMPPAFLKNLKSAPMKKGAMPLPKASPPGEKKFDTKKFEKTFGKKPL